MDQGVYGRTVSSPRRNIRVIIARSIGDVSDSSEPVTHVLVRVWLPDRPGALGLVASRIGAVDGDIVGIDVLERGDNVAVDEFAVVFRTSIALDLLVREIEEVDGASVEEVRTIDHFPDPRLDALESATTLCASGSVEHLHAHARRADARRIPRRLERAASPTARCWHRRARSRTRHRCSARWWRARPRPRWWPTARPDPTTSRSQRSPCTTPPCSSVVTVAPSGAANGRSWSRSSGIADRTWSLLS